MSNTVDFFNIPKIETIEELVTVTAAIADNVQLMPKDWVGKFIKKLPEGFHKLVYEPQKEVTKSDWERFDRSFSQIMSEVLKDEVLQEHLQCVHEIESLAKREFRTIDERVKPVVLFMNPVEKSAGSLDESDSKQRQVIIAKNRLIAVPSLRRMFTSSSSEIKSHVLDLTQSGSKEAFDVITTFLEGDPRYKEKITSTHFIAIVQFAAVHEFSDLAESCAQFLFEKIPVDTSTSFVTLIPELRLLLEGFVQGFEISVKTPGPNQSKVLHRYLELKLGGVNENLQKYRDELKEKLKTNPGSFLTKLLTEKIAYFIDKNRSKNELLSFYNQIIEHFLEVLKQDPTNAIAHSNLGAAYNGLKKYAEAKKHLLEAVKLDPANAIAHSNLGAAYIAFDEYGEAKNHLLKAVELNPGDVAAYSNLGLTLAVLGWHEWAKEQLLIAVELDPRNDLAYARLGYVYNRLGQYTKSRECLVKAVELNPRNATAHLNLALVCIELKGYEEAEKHLLEVIQLNSKKATAYLHLALVCIELKKYEKAEEHLLEVIKLDPTNASAHRRLGSLYVQLSYCDKAERCFLNSLKLDDTNASAHWSLGSLYAQLGYYDEAERRFLYVLKLGPTNGISHWDLDVVSTKLETIRGHKEMAEQFKKGREEIAKPSGRKEIAKQCKK